ncbi:hypothetical protein FHS85_005122 [Rhodoligotrophos appendicifer]|uniref:PhoX family protein n=1 Tax=Rhodoligotrophos appendicifer TaxID=987056 RepID=UPI00117C2A23|nr:PhoX family phosphatase [Rhodoligotrophos appendicifer]
MNEMMKPRGQFRAHAYEASDDVGRNDARNETMGDIIAARFSRRALLKGALAVTAIQATVSPLAMLASNPVHAATPSAFSFDEAMAGVDETHHVADGYDMQVLIRWGDKLFTDSPEFDPMTQTSDKQRRQFGYNNDYVGFIPLEGAPAGESRALLVVNHEYTDEHMMFPGIVTIEDKVPEGAAADAKPEPTLVVAPATKDRVDIEMAAHGGTVVEIRRREGAPWSVQLDSPYNRRITAETPIEITGPAAGNARLQTKEDPTGRSVKGTINNCAGGVTPWGTYLMAEENFHGYFSGSLPSDHRESANYKRLGIPGASYEWAGFYDRFDVSKEPNEPNRFGYIVEVDPLDAASTPKKRTALGRMKHEGAESVLAQDGRVVFYCGDDERFDYIYKFVTSGTFKPNDRAANMDLLDSGTLHVARFSADGTMEWLPLVYGQGPLTSANGFQSQADVVIETRRAADLLGATKMDRPEDVQANPKTGKVYAMLTNNTKRKADQVDAANPRAANAFGHIIEITETDGGFASSTGRWEVLLKCGDPAIASVGASFSTATTANGWFGMPDNCAIDAEGRLWVTTDGNSPKATGRTDGLWAVDTEGEARGTAKLFYRVPVGAEMCGPEPTPDLTTFFVAVQHPGDEGPDYAAFGRPSYFEDPSTRWPDFAKNMPPRPSVVAITRKNGGKIATTE